jgi:hypothetical protein
MDLGKALQNLYAERQRLEQIIAALQELQQRDATYGIGVAECEPETERRKRCRTGRRPLGIPAGVFET